MNAAPTRRPGAARWPWLPALLAVCAAAGAVDRLTVSVGSVAGPGWRAGAITAQLSFAPDHRPGLELRVGELSLPPPLDAFTSARVRCPAWRLRGTAVGCEGARLRLQGTGIEPLSLEVAWELDPEAGALAVTVRDQVLLGGRLDLELRSRGDDGSIEARLRHLPAGVVAGALAAAGIPVPVDVSEGRVSLELEASRRAGRMDADARVTLESLSFSDAGGLRAGEGLTLDLRLRAGGPAHDLSLDLEAAARAGAVYLHPVLVQVGDEPLTLAAQGRWPAAGAPSVSAFAVRDPGVAALAGAASFAGDGGLHLESFRAVLEPAPAGPLYRRYLQAFAGAGALSELTLVGDIGASLNWQAGGRSEARLRARGLDVGDAAGRFVVLSLDADVHWSRGAEPDPSVVAWREAQVYAVDLGPAALRLRLADREARLLAPLSVNLLDGRLHLERLEATSLGGDSQRVEADMSLDPVSLQRLSERLAWLPLAGQVAGRVPRLVFSERRLTVEGTVDVDLFGGQVRLSRLGLEDPFGVVPVLRVDVAVDDLDLGVLTRSFSFGGIEGRLGGRVRNLVLEAWQPVAFDAFLATPDDDASRHRISQRAVDNLASLGGARAVLSSTFLRVFSEFSYERLGLACRLRGGICHMGGVEDAERGYYIVKGGGLPPRVDVVGYNRRVDWQTLLERLRAVASSRGPVVR